MPALKCQPHAKNDRAGLERLTYKCADASNLMAVMQCIGCMRQAAMHAKADEGLFCSALRHRGSSDVDSAEVVPLAAHTVVIPEMPFSASGAHHRHAAMTPSLFSSIHPPLRCQLRQAPRWRTMGREAVAALRGNQASCLGSDGCERMSTGTPCAGSPFMGGSTGAPSAVAPAHARACGIYTQALYRADAAARTCRMPIFF